MSHFDVLDPPTINNEHSSKEKIDIDTIDALTQVHADMTEF